MNVVAAWMLPSQFLYSMADVSIQLITNNYPCSIIYTSCIYLYTHHVVVYVALSSPTASNHKESTSIIPMTLNEVQG